MPSCELAERFGDRACDGGTPARRLVRSAECPSELGAPQRRAAFGVVASQRLLQ